MKEKIKSLLTILIIILGTVALLYYSKGYRFNAEDNSFVPTGALTISSSEFRTDISINNENVGKTPKSVTSLKPGDYQLKLSKNGFLDWKRDLEIYQEKTVPIEATLFLDPKGRESSPIFKLDSYLIDLEVSNSQNQVYFITSSADNGFQETFKANQETTIEESAIPKTPLETETQKVIKVWRFNPNSNFWDFRENPTLVYETQIRDINNINLKSSERGGKTLLTYTDISQDGTPFIQTLSIDGTKFNPSPLDIQYEKLKAEVLTQVPTIETQSELDIQWSADENYLLLGYNSKLFTYELSTTLLQLVNTEDLSGTITATESDSEGNLYVATLDEDARSTIYVKPIQQASFEVFVKDLKSEIKSFYISREGEVIAINSGEKLSLYDINDKKLSTVSNTISQFIKFSPDNQKLLYRDFDNRKLGIYIFDKEEGDPSIEVGDKFEIRVSEEFNARMSFWSAEADFITYFDAGHFNTSDLFAFNRYRLSTSENSFGIPNLSANKLYTFETDGQFLNISQRQLR